MHYFEYGYDSIVKNSFVNKLKNYEDDKFVIFRSGATSEDMLPICWNAFKGSTWSKIFNVNNITRVSKF